MALTPAVSRHFLLKNLPYKVTGWDSWVRTNNDGIKIRCVTITLYPNMVLAYGYNPFPAEPQSAVLSLHQGRYIMARLRGFEPLTFWFVAKCSIPLS